MFGFHRLSENEGISDWTSLNFFGIASLCRKNLVKHSSKFAVRSQLGAFQTYSKRPFVFIFSLFLSFFGLDVPLSATQYYFQFSNTAEKAYRAAISLRLEESRALITTMQSQEPDNLMRHYVENYVDFLTVFLNEDEAEYKRLLKKAEKRFQLLSKGEKRSPYFLYTQAEARLQWAIVRGKFGDYLTAIQEVKQAYALLEENDKRYPEFIANQKSLGIIHAMVGNVPDEYRWAVKMFGGMQGTVELGLREVESVLKYSETHYLIFEEEALVTYSFLLLHLGNEQERAWKIMNNKKLNPAKNPLAGFAQANVAMRTGRNDEAITILQKMPDGAEYHPFHFKNYMLGVAKLNRLDKDANTYLEQYVNQFYGSYNIKEAWQKLGWHKLINGDEAGYRACMQQCINKGKDNHEPDKAALREAKSGELPDILLLKGRLLFDGGYHEKAWQTLSGQEKNYPTGSKFHLEYTYRMGRIAHKAGKNDAAKKYYTQTIEQGRSLPWLYACNASLQLGLLHEKLKESTQAKAAYQTCLSISPKDYSASLHMKAKAGLNRLKN
jgi:Tetratricopeptide repeat